MKFSIKDFFGECDRICRKLCKTTVKLYFLRSQHAFVFSDQEHPITSILYG